MKRIISRQSSDSYLRLWLRLLKCSHMIEARVRNGLRQEFSSTLPRFDMLAQLDAAGDEGLTMGELSRRLMVTNGNLTGLTARLVREKLVTRSAARHDRRTQRIRMTAAGRKNWERMAAAHRYWIETMFKTVSNTDVEHLHSLLGKLKNSVQGVTQENA
jgi:DNA-binding MarR family transcriptional regulator